MFKRLAARGKTPPPPVSSPVANSYAAESFDIEQNANGGEGDTSPVSPTSTFVVTVYGLDDDQKPFDIHVQRDSDGQWLFDEVCEQLGGLQEKDYFGLRFLDREKQRQWVDPTRNIYRQLKHIHPCCVSFRVKHYPPNPLEDLKQEISKYFLYLQIKRDIVHSRLLCQGSEAYELAAYIAQADLGDFEDIEDPETYLSEFKVLPNQSPKSETKIAEIHKTLTGILPNEAEAKCLALASKMETYGIDPYSVKDQKGNVLYLGLTHVGVVTFQGSRRAHIFKWSDITKFNYDGKLFIIHVTFREDNQFRRKKKHILGFKCESRAAALSLWRWAVDRYCFFTLKRSSEAKRSKSGGGLFRRSHTFRFSGRCQKEVLTTSASLMTLPQPVFTRTSSLRRDERTRPDVDEKFATFPRSRRNEPGDVVTMPRPTDSAADGAESDGGIVETIIVPSLSAPAACVPPPSERGIDVGDGDAIHPTLQQQQQYQPAEAPCKQPSPVPAQEDSSSSSPEVFLDSNGKVESAAAQSSVAPSAPPTSKRSRAWRCATGLAVLLLFSGATLVLLFEFGSSWRPTRPLLENAVFDDWRQQWYLPLRSRILPGQPQ